MMKYLTAFLLATLSLAGCPSRVPERQPGQAELKAAIRKHLELIETPITLSTSDLLGLTEAEVLKKNGRDKLNPERGTTNKKWFSGGGVHFPRSAYDDTYVWKRCHILTFEDDKVVKHEMVDRRTAHVSIRPREP